MSSEWTPWEELSNMEPEPEPDEKKQQTIRQAATTKAQGTGTSKRTVVADSAATLERIAKQVMSESKNNLSQSKQTNKKQSSISANTRSSDPEDDSAIEHQNLILAITRYLNSERFGPHLKKLGFKTTGLEKKKIPALQSYFDRIKVCIEQKNSNIPLETVKSVITYAEVMIKLATNNRVNIDGTADALWQDESFIDDVESLKLEMLSNMPFSRNSRIVIKLIMVSMSQARHNKLLFESGLRARNARADLRRDDKEQKTED